MASPGVYENRQPGGFTGQRQCFDSFRLKNRMFIVEEDARTHHENRYVQGYMEMYDVEDSLNVLKREFGRNIAFDVQAWWFDQHIGGGRYKDTDIYALFSKQQKIAKAFYEKDRTKISEVAFIYDEDSYHLISNESSHQMVELFNNYEIDKIGLPYDRYFKSDFFDEAMPDYKLYVFLNSLCLSEAERACIQEKLRKNHAVALFMYGCGVVDFGAEDKLSEKHIEKITKMQMKMENAVYRGKFQINGTAHAITENLDRGEIYGDFKRKMWANASSYMSRIKTSEVNLYPLIYTEDEEATVLAYFLDSKKPALTIKEHEDYISVYCGSKYLSCDVLKEIARYAKCHIYSETDDILYANRHYVTLHAASSGKKTIKLPAQCDVYDAYEEKLCSRNTDTIEVELLKGETVMYRLENNIENM